MATRWLAKAWEYDGLKEIKGEEDHPKIIEWHTLCGVPNPTDEIAWCASFVCGVLEESGVLSPRSAASKSFLDWGHEAGKLEPGVIIVFRGHVAIVSALEPELMIIGGNQSDGICEQPARFYGEILDGGMRWPAENLPDYVEEVPELTEEDAPPPPMEVVPPEQEEVPIDTQTMTMAEEQEYPGLDAPYAKAVVQLVQDCEERIKAAQLGQYEQICRRLDSAYGQFKGDPSFIEEIRGMFEGVNREIAYRFERILDMQKDKYDALAARLDKLSGREPTRSEPGAVQMIPKQAPKPRLT